jgi:hypothetical protein
MNVEIGTETPIFLFWEYVFRNFGILSLQCRIEDVFTADGSFIGYTDTQYVSLQFFFYFNKIG